MSCESEWLEAGGVSGSGGRPEIVIVDPPVLFNNGGSTKTISGRPPEMTWSCCLGCMPAGLEMLVPLNRSSEKSRSG